MKKNELKPWQKKEWCIPPAQDAAFVCQMEETFDIYKKPYDPQCPQVCRDEMSPQLIGEVRKPLPMKPGKSRKYDTEYKRNGVANIFMAFEPLIPLRQNASLINERSIIPTATLLEHALLTQGFMGASKAAFPRRLRPQNRDSTWANLVNTLK